MSPINFCEIVSKMRVKRDKRDDIFSKMIRARDGYYCVKCGVKHEETSTGLHCSHNVPRRYLRLRWTPLNAISLCFACHHWYGSEPYESGKWLEQYLGKRNLKLLLTMKQQKLKITKAVKEDIYTILKGERENQLNQLEIGQKYQLRDPILELLKHGKL
jgi:hypothetical protein